MAGPPSPENPEEPRVPAAVPMPPSIELIKRMPDAKASATKMFPRESTATPVGLLSLAATAGPPSPVGNPEAPVPATVEISLVDAVIRLTLWFPESTTIRSPDVGSMARPEGELRRAEVAGPPSPADPGEPTEPAKTDRTPGDPDRSLTAALPVSAMYSRPGKEGEAATPEGELKPSVALTTVEMTREERSTLRTALLPVSAMKIETPSVAIEAGHLRVAELARLPSPEKPGAPVPAKVVMMPVAASTLKTGGDHCAFRAT